MATRRRPPSLHGPALRTLRAAPDRAIQSDVIICLSCGRALRQLTNTHLAAHGLTADGYRELWGYPRREGLVCRALREFFRERAIRTQLAAKIRQRRLNSSACRGLTQRPVHVQRRIAAINFAAREQGRLRHPREIAVDVARVRQLRQAGLSLRAVAAHVGCSTRTVMNRLGHVFPSDYRPKYRRGGSTSGR